jgi:hypothetical protein
MPSTTEPLTTQSTRTAPARSVGKNLHAGYRTGSVLMTVLLSVTVLPLLLALLGGVINELTSTSWPGRLLVLGLSLPLLVFSGSLLLGLVRPGYVLVMDDQGVTYTQTKTRTQPIPWTHLVAVQEQLTDREEDRSARFTVTYRPDGPDGNQRNKTLVIEQSLLDVERSQIRAVFEDRFGPLGAPPHAQPESFGSKLGRGVVITVATAVTDRIFK